MANYNHLIRELSRLDPYEKAGFDSFRRTGTMLRHGQYLYLVMHGADRHTLEAINDWKPSMTRLLFGSRDRLSPLSTKDMEIPA